MSNLRQPANIETSAFFHGRYPTCRCLISAGPTVENVCIAVDVEAWHLVKASSSFMDFRWETRTARVSAPFGVVVDLDRPATDSLVGETLQSMLCIIDRVKVDEAVARVTAREGIDGDVDFLSRKRWTLVRP